VFVDRRNRPLIGRLGVEECDLPRDCSAYVDTFKKYVQPELPAVEQFIPLILNGPMSFQDIAAALETDILHFEGADISRVSAYGKEVDAFVSLPDSEMQRDFRRIVSWLGTKAFQLELAAAAGGGSPAIVASAFELIHKRLYSGTRGSEADRVALRDEVQLGLESGGLSLSRFLRQDRKFLEAVRRFKMLARRGDREAMFNLGRMLLIDGQYEAGVAVMMPLLNEGDSRVITEIANYFLRVDIPPNSHLVEDADEFFSRLRFFEMLALDENEQMRWDGRCWAAIIARRAEGKNGALKWLPMGLPTGEGSEFRRLRYDLIIGPDNS
jgi:hypothetical protein